MNASLNLDQIARHLKAERRGTVTSQGGYFGALQLAAEVTKSALSTKDSESASPSFRTEELLILLSVKTHEQLEKLAQSTHTSCDRVAALLLEQAVQDAVGAN